MVGEALILSLFDARALDVDEVDLCEEWEEDRRVCW